MFRKLFKYDFQSIRRIGLPLLLGILGAGVLGLLVAFLSSTLLPKEIAYENFFVVFLSIITSSVISLVAFVIPLGAAAIHVIVFVNFYRSLITDEGYLTFTLPVRAADIIRSKFWNAMLWSALSLVATVLAFAAFLLPMGAADVTVLSEIRYAFSEIGRAWGMGAAEGWVLLFLLILLIPVSVANTFLMYFGAIFFGSVVSGKNKLLSAILCIFGVNFLYSIASGIFVGISSLFGGIAGAATNSIPLAFIVMLLLAVIALSGVNVAFYFILKHMMEKKINLS